MIKIKDLNKYYNKGKDNEIHVINHITLELPSTGLVSFLGASGSGKTTLLNVIGGLDKAKGSICYDDLFLENYQMHKIDQFRNKEIGYVFQNYNLLLEETVYNNLAIALEMIGIYDLTEQEKRIEYTLKAVGMYKYRKKRAYALSGGQQQRVSIARALIKQTKIIIADEPTGNLDSENTIEVMNILKKISKSSLVLVVTHNEEVANFYSDQVIRIKDGSIVDSFSNDGKQSLNTEQSNIIYLKDLSLNEEKSDLINLKYYSTKDAKPIELLLVEKNGTFYISSSERLKLIEDTNLKLVDAHYQALKQEEVDQFDFDTSWYKDTSKGQNIGKRLFRSILESFNKIRFSKKRTKFLYFAFFTIGILLAVCVIGFSNYYLIDDSSFNVDKSFQVIDNQNYIAADSYNKQLLSNLEYVENVTVSTYYPIQFSKQINFSETISYNTNTTVISYKGSENLKLLAGTAPKKNEILISKKIADDWMKELKEFFPSYDSFIGINNKIVRQNETICGVIDNPYSLVYMDDASFLEYVNDASSEKLNYRSYEIEHEYDTYEILSGRDLTIEDSSSNVVLASDPSLLGKKVYYYGRNCEVVGIFQFKKYQIDELTLMAYSTTRISTPQFKENYSYAYKDYEIVEGKDAKAQDECIVSVYSNYDVGEEITIDSRTYKIVGKYYSDSITLGECLLFSREACLLGAAGANRLWFQVKDEKALNEALEEGFYSINIYSLYRNEAQIFQQENFMVFGIFALVLLIIIAIFIYFIMRSRMISDIYPIGVYRSIGAPRIKIVLKFVCDILVTITLTSLLGYLITMFIFQTIAANINDTLSMNALKSSYLFSSLGVLILYVFNLIFGLLPIFLLMRKTPAEIIAKYDI